ncbi:MAG: serine hydrolase domain-containing protein [Candidatus Xenobia bacterium]
MWELRFHNQTREYRAAESEGQDLLKDPDLDAESRADVYLQIFFAQVSQGEHREAEMTYMEFCTAADRMTQDRGFLKQQMWDLRTSLGLPTQGLQADAPRGSLYMPATRGINAEILHLILDLNRETGAEGLLVLYHGQRILEWRSPYYHEPVYTMSSVKSITALLAGILADRGRLAVEDRVSRFLPAWSDGLRAQVRIKDLLRMSAGLLKQATGVGMQSTEDANLYVEGLHPDVPPGTQWYYSNEGVQLLSPILSAASGQNLATFAQQALFKPMGLEHTRLRTVGGSVYTYADAETTLGEFARFGQLVLDQGRFQGHQIVSRRWLKAMLTPSPLKRDYGYLWWLTSKPVRTWSMQGYLNTSVWVVPDSSLVIARVQSRSYLHIRTAFDSEKLLGLVTRLITHP